MKKKTPIDNSQNDGYQLNRIDELTKEDAQMVLAGINPTFTKDKSKPRMNSIEPYTASAVLDITEELREYLYRISGLEAKTHCSYEQLIESNNPPQVMVTSYFLFRQADLYVFVKDPNVPDGVLGKSFDFPREEARDINIRMRDLGKEFVPKFTPGQFGSIMPRDGKNARISPNKEILRVDLDLPLSTLREAVFRTDSSPLLRERSEFTYSDPDRLRAEAVVTKNGETNIQLIDKEFDEIFTVPITAEEEKNAFMVAKTVAERELKKAAEKFFKKEDAASKPKKPHKFSFGNR